MHKVINVENWAKRKNFEWFNTFSNPCYAIDTEIDVTEVVKFSKETKTSFFINFLYLVMKSLNAVEELRLRIVNNEVRLYDVIDPTYIVMTNTGIFENCGSKMYEDYKNFYQAAHEEVEKAKLQTSVKDEYNDSSYNVYYITCIPWLSYTTMSHPLPDNNKESSSVPRICWGKYELKNDRYVMPFNLNVSHALVDGYPLAKALNNLKDNSLNCLELFK